MKNIIYLIFIVLYGCTLSVETDIDKKIDSANTETKLPNDIRWITNSDEYKILCEQTYKNAWDNLSDIL